MLGRLTPVAFVFGLTLCCSGCAALIGAFGGESSPSLRTDTPRRVCSHCGAMDVLSIPKGAESASSDALEAGDNAAAHHSENIVIGQAEAFQQLQYINVAARLAWKGSSCMEIPGKNCRLDALQQGCSPDATASKDIKGIRLIAVYLKKAGADSIGLISNYGLDAAEYNHNMGSWSVFYRAYAEEIQAPAASAYSFQLCAGESCTIVGVFRVEDNRNVEALRLTSLLADSFAFTLPIQIEGRAFEYRILFAARDPRCEEWSYPELDVSYGRGD